MFAQRSDNAKKSAAEIIGTFCLVFAGTGAIVINDVSSGKGTHVGVALTFGLVVMSMIYAIGDVSGAHLNPAARRLPLDKSAFRWLHSSCMETDRDMAS